MLLRLDSRGQTHGCRRLLLEVGPVVGSEVYLSTTRFYLVGGLYNVNLLLPFPFAFLFLIVSCLGFSSACWPATPLEFYERLLPLPSDCITGWDSLKDDEQLEIPKLRLG